MIPLFITNEDANNTSNNGSRVQLVINPPIQLDPNKKYMASAREVDITYCFPNIFTGVNNMFKFSSDGTTYYTVYFSQGIYSIQAFQDEINRQTQENVQNNKVFVLEPDPSSSHIYIHFMSKTAKIDCNGSNNVMQLIGYSEASVIQTYPSGILGPVSHVNDFYEGDKASLDKVFNVLVLSSLIGGSYYNGQSKNVLCSVTPDVQPFSNIEYRPQLPLEVPVTKYLLDNLTFELVDQSFNPINMAVNTPGATPEKWSMRVAITEV